MRKKLGYISEIIILLFVIGVWCFSLYKVFSYIRTLNFKSWGANWEFNYFWEYPLKPPLPPEPPCPPPCPPPCVTPTPTPTPTTPVEQPTPTPTSPPGVPPPAVGGPPGAPVCGAETPKAPYLWSATVLGAGKVELVWDPVEPATHYSISYGPSSGNYLYGVSDTGKVTSFTVGGLGGGNYCFAVRAVNDCAPGELSNERCTGAPGMVLGVTTLGPTGSFDEELFQILFIIGCVCLGAGLKLFLPAKRLV